MQALNAVGVQLFEASLDGFVADEQNQTIWGSGFRV